MNIAKSNRFVVEPKNLLIYIGFVVAITMYLVYLDEGYFNFNWMSNPGTWFVFTLYSLYFLIVCLLADAFLFRKLSGLQKGLTTIACFIVFLAVFVLSTAVN